MLIQSFRCPLYCAPALQAVKIHLSDQRAGIKDARWLGPYSRAATLNVAPKSDSAWELRELAFNGLARIYKPGYGYRRAGVTLGALELADLVAKRLWADERYERQQRLMATVDHLNGKYGHDTVRCGISPTTGAWRTRFAKRSPRYTTRWPEICEAMAK